MISIGTIQIRDSNQYPLDKQGKVIHIVTLTKGLREFIYLATWNGSSYDTYLNEITGGTLCEIEEDDLFEELGEFITDRKINMMWNTNV